MGGGQIIYGLKDDGTVDNGGVSTQVKNGTKEWLERRIAKSTENEITGFRVRRVEEALCAEDGYRKENCERRP